jgi:hypothetical protein
MSSALKRVAAVAAVGTTAVLASAGGASAATMPVASPKLAFPVPASSLPAFALPALPGGGLPGLAPGLAPGLTPPPLSFVGPSVGQVAAVIGPTVLTTAPSNFSNTNIQTSAGGNLSGGQAGL